jgi:hypothetical protein
MGAKIKITRSLEMKGGNIKHNVNKSIAIYGFNVVFNE